MVSSWTKSAECFFLLIQGPQCFPIDLWKYNDTSLYNGNFLNLFFELIYGLVHLCFKNEDMKDGNLFVLSTVFLFL